MSGSILLAGADTGFPVGGARAPRGGTNIQICQILANTA